MMEGEVTRSRWRGWSWDEGKEGGREGGRECAFYEKGAA